jgi:hypothetical protein
MAAALPGKSLAYFDGTTVDGGSTGAPNAVPYSQASPNNWLLRDATGNSIHPYRDTTRYVGDVGLNAYQQAAITNILTDLATTPGIKGVMMDNVMPDIEYFSTCSCWPAKYPNASSWQTALASFVQVVGSALKSHGYYVLINTTGYNPTASGYDAGTATQNWVARLAQTGGISGVLQEYWMQDPNSLTTLMNDSSPGSYMHSWSGWQGVLGVAQANGVDFFGFTQGPSGNGQMMRYGKGSFLLAWNGAGGMFGYEVSPAYTGPDPWNAAWTTDIGTPTGAKYQIASDVWRRDYTRGVVIVNPTLAPFTTTINGTSHIIAPTDALILPS